MLNKYHQLAIELKYEGKTNKQIAEALKGKLAFNTIVMYFSPSNGLLLDPYREYCEEQGKLRQEEGRAKLQKEIPSMVQVRVNDISLLIRRAESEFNPRNEKNPVKLAKLMEDHEDKKLAYYERAFSLAERVLDRSGLSVISKAQLETKDTGAMKPLTKDEFFKQLEQRGIEPRSGIRIRAIEVAAEATKTGK